MKRFSTLITAGICLALMFSISIAGDAQSKFEKMKTLAGDWQGTRPDGKPVVVSYEVVANGSVLMERLTGEGEPSMITMYHMDGDNLMMTHYCSAMNQPRMVAAHTDNDKVVSFTMKDATNLPDHSMGHMHAMELTLKGEDVITHKWSFMEGGKHMAAPFDLKRVKMSDK